MNHLHRYRLIYQLAAGFILSATALISPARTVTGAGASFPYPIYARWAAQYHQETGKQVNYQSIGSGGGQQQVIARTVDFGASDDPMPGAALEQHQLLQFPAVIGGVVPVINVDGLNPGQLRLSGAVLADIFLGKIKTWDDTAIAMLNPGVRLPTRAIIVIHRSDGSGTTFGWTNYLSKVSPDWKTRVGEGKSVKWPTGQGGKGNEGVAAYVRQLKNSIGYVEYAYAKQNRLAWTQVQNHAGVFVQPGQESFAAAAANADWNSAPGMGVVLTEAPGAQSWPVTSASFILVHRQQRRAETGRAVLAFFDWTFRHGAQAARELDYVSMPEAVIAQITEAWETRIHTEEGDPIWP